MFNTQTRRAFLNRGSQGLGTVALASLLGGNSLTAQPSRGVIQNLAYPQKAKRVIWLTMAGGPSQPWNSSTTSPSWPKWTASRCPRVSPRDNNWPSCRDRKPSAKAGCSVPEVRRMPDGAVGTAAGDWVSGR